MRAVNAVVATVEASRPVGVALALGAPLGRAAWGGANDRLPTRLRIASGIAAGQSMS